MPKIILFVCYGNTCRSPMVAAIMQEALGPDYICISAGSGYSTTAPNVHENAFKALQEIKCGTIADPKSKQVTQEMIEKADLVVCLGTEVREEIIEDFCEEALEDFATGKTLKNMVASEIDEDKIVEYAPQMLKFYDPYDLDGYKKSEIEEKGLKGRDLKTYIDVAEKIRDTYTPLFLHRYFPEKLPAWQEKISKIQAPSPSVETSDSKNMASETSKSSSLS